MLFATSTGCVPREIAPEQVQLASVKIIVMFIRLSMNYIDDTV